MAKRPDPVAAGEQKNTELLDHARALVVHLEAGESEQAGQVLDLMTELRESELFREVGQLTRTLHDALTIFRNDSRLSAIASEIPDTQDRLQHVIELTEQSAHRTLGAVENSLFLVQELGRSAQDVGQRWDSFRKRELQAEEFRGLCRDMDGFMARINEDGERLQAELTTALMAQDYQDITGQIIRKVITLVKDVEAGLVSMIRLSDQTPENSSAADKQWQKTDRERLEGPQIPGKETDGAVSGQDEVDDLLSSLGF